MYLQQEEYTSAQASEVTFTERCDYFAKTRLGVTGSFGGVLRFAKEVRSHLSRGRFLPVCTVTVSAPSTLAHGLLNLSPHWEQRREGSAVPQARVPPCLPELRKGNRKHLGCIKSDAEKKTYLLLFFQAGKFSFGLSCFLCPFLSHQSTESVSKGRSRGLALILMTRGQFPAG